MRSVLSILVFCSILSAQTPEMMYNKLVNDLNGLAVDESKCGEVLNLQLSRGGATIRLNKGTLYLLSPINNSQHALLFIGEGIILCNPPTDIERKQLYRFYEKEALDEPFETLFMLFTDSTYEELTRQVSFITFRFQHTIGSILNRSLRFLKDRKGDTFDFDILRTFLFDDNERFFYAHLNNGGSDSYFFKVDPYEREEISIGANFARGGLFSADYSRESICIYNMTGDDRSQTGISSLSINTYTMEIMLDEKLNLSATCSMVLLNKASHRQWIPLSLFPELRVDSVLINGKKGTFIQPEESWTLWLAQGDFFPTNSDITVTLFYKGEVIKRIESWFVLESSLGWYPRSTEERTYSTFDLTFHTPSYLQLISIGEKISSTMKEDVATTRWRLKTPSRNASFMVGKFDEQTIVKSGIPPIAVYITNSIGTDRKNASSSEEVAEDIENSIRFFQHHFGKAISSQFSAVEIFTYHGEAFPSFIHLSALTFRAAGVDGTEEIFRAHEVAHQWWGVGVDFKTYHDQWLSEAFAEYSGLWYMQTVLKDNEKFFNMLKAYKKAIFNNRKYLFGSGQEAGPIWLGRRTSSSKTPNDYGLIIYNKGAWVLHMLRNMALDLKTMKEDVFIGLMKEFYTTYAGKQASTEDFQRIVEKNFGIDMNWFFKQWIYNTEIPTYTVSYKLEELADKKYKVHCIVKQTNVPDDFQMYVPFFIDFGNNQFARLRYLIKGPVTEFDFPVLPLKPEEIKFNDLASVLCEIEDEDWD